MVKQCLTLQLALLHYMRIPAIKYNTSVTKSKENEHQTTQ